MIAQLCALAPGKKPHINGGNREQPGCVVHITKLDMYGPHAHQGGNNLKTGS